MKAAVLIDNTGDKKLKGDWGLSFFIEYKNHRILLDFGGKSCLFAENAEKMGLSLKDVDFAVLSHAHYDHADGMTEFFRQNENAKLYLRESCRENCYRIKEGHMKYIGIQKGLLEKYRDRLVYTGEDRMLCPGVSLIGHHTAGLAEIGKREQMFLKESDRWVTDSFEHEQSLVLECKKGIVIFNSCSHGGADNIIREVSQLYPGRKILAMIGGFHLYNKTDEYIAQFAERLLRAGVEKIYTGHCTGENGCRILTDMLGDKVCLLRAGMKISVSQI